MKVNVRSVMVLLLVFTAGVKTSQASYVSTVLADSPLVYYRMQESDSSFGASAADSSGNSRTGQYLWAFGGPGSISSTPGATAELNPGKQFTLAFNGGQNANTGAFIDVVHNLSGAPTNAFSVEFLIKPNAGTFTSSVFAALYTTNGGFGGGDIHLNIFPSSGNLELAVAGNGVYPQANLSSVAPVGQWTHVVVTYGGGLAKFYANGTLLNPGGTSTSGSTPGNLNLFSKIGTWNGDSRFFNGGLDEFAIYNITLSDAQVAAHFAAIPEPSGLTLMGLALVGMARFVRRRRS